MPVSPVTLAQELIRFDTVNPPGNERACASYLGEMLERAGFAVSCHEFEQGRTNLVARIGGSDKKPALCFTGHLDTVPLGLQPWSVDPFAAEIEDGRLYGRGSTDMKSGVAAFCLAAVSLADHLEGSPGLELVITADEETGCNGACRLARRAGSLSKAGAIIVAEPSSNRPWVGHKGVLWLRAVTNGVSAHGSMPEKGVNAVYKAVHAVSRLEDFDFDISPHNVVGPPTLNVGTIQGGANINSVPDQAEFSIDIRTIPSQDHDCLRDRLTSYLGNEVILETVVDLSGIWTEPESTWVQEVFAIASDITSWTPTVETAHYFTDASVLTPAYGNPPTIVLGPGEAPMAHQTDEYCFIARIEEALQIYIEIARRWCGV